MNSNTRVLQVIHSLGMGGAETWMLRVLKFWSENNIQNIEVDFLITSGEKSVLDKQISQIGGRIHYIKLNKSTVFPFFFQYRKLLKERKYNAIHNHQDFLSGWLFLFGWGRQPTIKVSHVHNPAYQLLENYGVSMRRRIQLNFGKLLVRRFSTHICGTSRNILSEYGVNNFSFPKQAIKALHCSFSPNDWRGDYRSSKEKLCIEQGWETTTKVVLFVGRLDYSLDICHPQNHKNSVFALSILAACSDDPEIKMLMVGANEYIKQDFLSLANSLGLQERVRLLGIRHDVPELMLGSDILLFPSRAEGLGMVAVEAQAAGLPVLASSAVPDECVVIEELVEFCSLDQSIELWAYLIKKILYKGRRNSTEDDIRWETSGFNIKVGSQDLLNLYKGLW